MFNILDRYIGKTILATTGLSLAVLAGLSALIRFVEQVRAIGRGTYDMMDVLAFVLLSIPRDVEQFFPMATLLGGLIGIGLLASNSELVVMMAAGRSRLNIVSSAMKSAIIMMLAITALGEWVAPQLESQARQLRAQAVSGGSLISGPQGQWAKDGNQFINIGEVQDTGLLQDLTIYQFSAERELERVVRGESAHFIGPDWRVRNVTYTEMGEERIDNYRLASWSWQTGLTPEKLGVLTVRPESLPISGLNSYINYLKANNQDASRYELALWRKILAPLTVAVMLLVALSFIFGPLRSVTMGARVLLGVITGFVFHVANQVFGPIAQVYHLPPVMGAALPSLLFAAAAIYVMHRQKT
ncbi:lipopolysaccharide ABC transporter permease LptG [Aliidiomarina minuta]|uniref:Lipopolysaccharide ABC transporter permease LptG n=1 Tax=Aliidiomarina minuta TaxID=880057 RepID=A0A432W1J6_9GAMM|nr:LPS export ABC transporter permease LptG [Aliidiomarina minuta]RUO22996.1 lipopolysaccharide ABC transporter permease LptG [Aliidiomarina minuta]